MANNRHTLHRSYTNVSKLSNSRFIDRNDENLRRYLTDVRSFKVLTKDEEYDLIRQYKEHGPNYMKVKNQIIGSNQRFVITLAKRYCPIDVPLIDIIDEGNIGLCIALDNFDNTMNVRFLTYANSYIVKYIFEFLERNGFIKQTNRAHIHGTITKVEEEFFNKYERYPTDAELQEEFEKRGISIKDKRDFHKIEVESLDKNFGNPDAEQFEVPDYRPEADEYCNHDILCKNIKIALETLTEQEKKIVTMSFGLMDTPQYEAGTISMMLGISEFKVKSILDGAIAKLSKMKGYFK